MYFQKNFCQPNTSVGPLGQQRKQARVGGQDRQPLRKVPRQGPLQLRGRHPHVRHRGSLQGPRAEAGRFQNLDTGLEMQRRAGLNNFHVSKLKWLFQVKGCSAGVLVRADPMDPEDPGSNPYNAQDLLFF